MTRIREWPPVRSPRADPSDHTPVIDKPSRRYRVRFAQTNADLDAVFRLRFDVFNMELGEGLPQSYGTQRDQDRFDPQCQHLVVLSEDSGDVIGTYRLQVAETSLRGEGFYSAGEFDFAYLPPEVVADGVELGRACIRKDHRNREVLFLLWQGLAAYVLWNEKRYFFGCSSLTSTDPYEGVRMYEHLRSIGHVHPNIDVPVRPGFECVATGSLKPLPPIEIPALFRAYLRYGAKVVAPPALDREFKTIDFLTLLDVAGIDERTFQMFLR
jgi:putative hemolysin